MKLRSTQAASTALRAAMLGKNFGYRIEGDVATVNAEIVRCKPEAAQCDWRLQLWACREPFEGGRISGVKLVDVAAGTLERTPTVVAASAPVTLPADTRFHSMVMVLASQESGNFATIHDYANFPMSQSFLLPRMSGTVGYRFDGATVHLDVEGVENPRDADNVSGTLSLELWALPERYAGGDFHGTPLAGIGIGTIQGRSSIGPLSFALPLGDAGGDRYVTLMLREWTANGYMTRDYACFANKVAFGRSSDNADEAAKASSKPRAKATKVMSAVIGTTVPAAKKRAGKAAAGDKADVAKDSSTVGDAGTVTKEEVLRSRGRGRKLLAKITSVSRQRNQPRNSTRH